MWTSLLVLTPNSLTVWLKRKNLYMCQTSVCQKCVFNPASPSPVLVCDQCKCHHSSHLVLNSQFNTWWYISLSHIHSFQKLEILFYFITCMCPLMHILMLWPLVSFLSIIAIIPNCSPLLWLPSLPSNTFSILLNEKNISVHVLLHQ